MLGTALKYIELERLWGRLPSLWSHGRDSGSIFALISPGRKWRPPKIFASVFVFNFSLKQNSCRKVHVFLTCTACQHSQTVHISVTSTLIKKKSTTNTPAETCAPSSHLPPDTHKDLTSHRVDVHLWDPCQTSDLKNCEMINLCCFKLLSLW